MKLYRFTTSLIVLSLLLAQPVFADVAADASSTPTLAPTPDATTQDTNTVASDASSAPGNDASVPAATSSTPDMSTTQSAIADTASSDASSTVLASDATTTSDSATTTNTAIQETASLQQTASTEALVVTANPQPATTTSSATTTVVVDASTTPVAAPVAPAAPQVVAAVESDPLPAPETPQPPIVPPKMIPIAVIEKPKERTYQFTLTGKTIPAHATRDDGTETDVSQPATTTVDSAGSMTVSGECSGAYYVVLVYAHQDDYMNDRRSYVLNRAYPCQNGSFTYAVSNIPSTLAAGTYYLLVGEESGATGWKPITALTEITIKSN